MIQILSDGYCKGCPFMDLEVQTIYEDNEVYSQDICCIHEAACNRVFWLARSSQKEQVQ